jgi:hypothetical protein
VVLKGDDLRRPDALNVLRRLQRRQKFGSEKKRREISRDGDAISVLGRRAAALDFGVTRRNWPRRADFHAKLSGSFSVRGRERPRRPSLPSNLCCSDRGGIFADSAFLATSGDR